MTERTGCYDQAAGVIFTHDVWGKTNHAVRHIAGASMAFRAARSWDDYGSRWRIVGSSILRYMIRDEGASLT